ncbi:MAG: hypothetical protein AAFS00_14340 [Bacteroidota bacterium]
MYPFFSPSQLRGLGILSLFCLFILGIKLSLHWIPQHPLVYWKHCQWLFILRQLHLLNCLGST